MMEVLRDFRSGDLIRALQYISTKLHEEHPEPVALSNLPSPARENALSVAVYFQGIGTFATLGILDKDIIERALSRQVIVSWLALEPYVLKERERGMSAISGFRYFEDLAVGSTHRWLSNPEFNLRTFDFDSATRSQLA
jgi:hypothetical protein